MAIESVFKALGDPARVRILQMLSENGEMAAHNITVCERKEDTIWN